MILIYSEACGNWTKDNEEGCEEWWGQKHKVIVTCTIVAALVEKQ